MSARRQLIISVEMPGGDLPVLDALLDEVESHLNVFSPAIKNWILA